MVLKHEDDQVQLWCEDFLEGLTYQASRIADQSVDCILTDLPYGTTRCKWDAVIPFDKMWEVFNRVIKPGRAIILNSAQPFTSVLIASNLKHFAYTWGWNKVFAANYVQAKRTPLRVLEDVCVFSTNGKTPAYFPVMVKRDKPIYKGKNDQSEAIPIAQTDHAKGFAKVNGKRREYTHKFPTNMITFNIRSDRAEMKRKGLKHHPTQKPVSLCEYLIETYTQPGETVLDCCLGSGTTALACKNLGRKFKGFESNVEYFIQSVIRLDTE